MSILKIVPKNPYPHLKEYVRPDSYMGPTFEGYYDAGVGQCRDSDTLAQSNFEAMTNALDTTRESVVIHRSSHWAVGWVENIYIKADDHEQLKIANDLMASYESYPVLDEELYSEYRSEEAESTLENYMSDFRKTILDIIGMEEDDLSHSEHDEVDVIVRNVFEADRSYSGDEDAFVTDEAVERFVDDEIDLPYWTDNNLFKLLAAIFNVGEV